MSLVVPIYAQSYLVKRLLRTSILYVFLACRTKIDSCFRRIKAVWLLHVGFVFFFSITMLMLPLPLLILMCNFNIPTLMADVIYYCSACSLFLKLNVCLFSKGNLGGWMKMSH